MLVECRRSFLKLSVFGGLSCGLPASLRAAGANERINLGVIGCGQRGRWFYDRAHYVCDPDRTRLAQAASKAGLPASRAVTDMRRIFDDPEVHAVVIATCDHWHAPAALLALEAGKHVYVEKPAAHNFRESQLLVAAAKRTGLVVQHGTQQRSTPFVSHGIEQLHAGVIGDVLVARAWNVQRRKNIGYAQPAPPPPGVDYDLWVGPAEMVPFQSNRFHDHWRWWYNFGTGDTGNDGIHEIDYARWGLGVDTLPSRIVGLGGKYYHDDQQQFPDTATMVFEYPGDGQVGHRRQLIFEMRLWSKNYPYHCDNGVEFLGTKGKMVLSKRGKLLVWDDQDQQIEQQTSKQSITMDHLDDFLDAIRTGRQPHAPVEEAHRSVALAHLGNIAVRTGRSLAFDPAREEILNDAEAAQFLHRSYRSEGHWAIPAGV